ncbi:hypothetical protein ACIRBX_12095 [Kitasatospora sp. NPDC096147]|uniref:hypothetical protein n=1 Tax=Kitasatospora sp. NPDC096147 TaxID=3364093 RepID=UPI0037FBB364
MFKTARIAFSRIFGTKTAPKVPMGRDQEMILDAFSRLLAECTVDGETIFTCDEAEALSSAFSAFYCGPMAELIMAHHAAHDTEPGDRHHVEYLMCDDLEFAV